MRTIPVKRVYSTRDEAIRAAKQRARSFYYTQYIYPAGEGFYIRGKLDMDRKPIVKVLFDGSVVELGE